MKSINIYVTEKFKLSKNTSTYLYYPKTWNELREIIEQRYKEQGSGTEQEPVDFKDIDVSNINSFCYKSKGIFEGTEFEYIDISNWDVSKVEDMHYMFDRCEELTSVGDLSNWDVSKVEDMRFMFYGCKQLKSVGDLSNWNVSNVEDMGWMFKESGITNIPDWYKG